MLTSAGKKHTIPPITATAPIPRPKIRVISGAIATSGTDRSMRATGRKVCSTGAANTNTHATRRASTIPPT